MNAGFKIQSEYKPAGDQPKAIESLLSGIKKGMRHQTLLGVTGSGKTFTAANIIQAVQKPTLVIAHNKTLAAQLAQEYRDFFPHNAVHYFVSYYDYYQPEAYMPTSDTYIEKEAQINEEIDRLRHASTQALLTRRDVIIVASVSCIYGLGSPAEYEKVHMKIEKGTKTNRADMIRALVRLYFERTNADLLPGTFRAVGNTVEIMPTNERIIYRLGFAGEEARGASSRLIEDFSERSDEKSPMSGQHRYGDAIVSLTKIDAISRTIIEESEVFYLFPAKHFVTPEDERKRAIVDIQAELKQQLATFAKEGKILEAERLKRRSQYDIALLREIGYCNGIENYSRHFDGRKAGEPPHTLLSYFPHVPCPQCQGLTLTKKAGVNVKVKPCHACGGTGKVADFLTIIDESHVTVPQLGGMYAGDRSRKETLVLHGFRLPSAKDNRPLTFDEFDARVGQILYTSATPGTYEYEHSKGTNGQIVEQIIRPTGLVDPEIDLRPIVEKGAYPGQIKDFIQESEKVIARGGRVLVTTLTKKMAEDLSEFLKDKKIKSEYIHSDIKTIDRITTLTEFRRGTFDCLVGVNLLREGLDLPEVELVAVLDADKEGFLRSETSLIQTIGRAARNVAGRVILYADSVTSAMEKAMSETNRRRALQVAYNTKHHITPLSIKKQIRDITDQLQTEHTKTVDALVALDAFDFAKSPKKTIKEKQKQMNEAVRMLDFETAALLRDEIRILESRMPKK